MRALVRTISSTVSPRASPKSSKGKGREIRYSASDLKRACERITATFAAAREGNSKDADSLATLSKDVDILVDALASEATAYAMDESTGPCLEYMLTNDVLSSLVQDSLADNPPGALGLIVKAFDTLVVLLGDEFIALASRPLSRLLKGCFVPPSASASAGHAKEGSAESAEMDRLPSTNFRAERYSPQLASLLCGICSRIKAHPDLLPIFFQHKRLAADRGPKVHSNIHRSTAIKTLEVLKSPTPSNRSLSTVSSQEAASDTHSASARSTTDTSSASRSLVDGNAPPTKETSQQQSKQYDLPLLTYLLKYVHRDGRTGEFARAGVLFLVDLAMRGPSPSPTTSAKDTKAARRRTLVANASVRRPSPVSVQSSDEAGTAAPLQQALAAYIALSDLAEIVGAGIGALYGLLHSKIYVPPLPTSLPGTGLPVPSRAQAGDVFDADMQEADEQQELLQDLRSDGYAVQGDKELVDQIEGWSRIVEFAQDLVRRAQSSPDGSELVQHVLASIRTAFLQNTLYPSILESSTSDGTGVAILTYLEALFTLLEADSPLSECIMAFLSGHDGGGPSLAQSESEAASQPMATRAISSIRYTLRDLLLAHLQPRSHHEGDKGEAGTLPLRVLHLVLGKFDAVALELFDIVPDLEATRFPFDCSRDPGHEEKKERQDENEDEEETFHYPGARGEADSEAESFVYPSPGRPQIENPIPQPAPSSSESTVSGPTELELLLRLSTPSSSHVPQNDSTSHARANTSGSSFFDVGPSLAGDGSGSTAHASYLRDAEAALCADVSFRRGVLLLEAMEADSAAGEMKLLCSPPGLPALSRSSINDAMTMHRLFPGSLLVQHILTHLARFFLNSPAYNLALTAVLGKLAICPYRSLGGWLLPAELPLRKLGQAGLLPLDFEAIVAESTGDLPPFASRKQSPRLSAEEQVLKPEEGAVFAALEGLMRLVGRYKREIRQFDKHLQERREGMLFVEDLAEAIGNDASTEAVSRPSMPRSGSTRFNTQSTPTRPKKGSLFGRYAAQEQEQQQAALSPYAAHYAQTSETRVQAYFLPLLREASAGRSWSEASEDKTPLTPTPAQAKQPQESKSKMISFSMLLDNTIILEEAVKELVAIVVVRKGLGIDSV